jgi:transposase
MKLSENEIKKRLEKLRNYERLYPELKEKYEAQKIEIRELKAALAKERKERQEETEMFKLQIEELQRMVFGKRKKDNDDKNGSGKAMSQKKKKGERKKRVSKSYRREIPKEEEVTETTYHSIDTCPDCKESLSDTKEVVRYVEDIIIPVFIGKKVEKQCIETGFCRNCRRHFSGISIAKQHCVLGENVRQRIVYATTVLGMTFEKIRSDLRDTFGLDVSDGEIVVILTKEATKLLPEYHAIDATIRGAPVKHLDETSCPVQKEGHGQWAWIKTASNSFDTLFRLGQSRGKGNAIALCNEPSQITVTDDYGAYDFLKEFQALCWAHPSRKFRDLAESKSLSEKGKTTAITFNEDFKKLLKAVKKVVGSPYDRMKREKIAKQFEHRMKKLCAPNDSDPKKLATLKKTFFQRKTSYLICVREDHVPMTNNTAERRLRPLVIKRKLSFGHKTQKGADVMSILLSVAFTTWWKCQASDEKFNFYQAYRQIIQKWLPA